MISVYLFPLILLLACSLVPIPLSVVEDNTVKWICYKGCPNFL